ncbi:MAG TPA: four-carbon acid sugar kinase family protein [Thermodesulfobacteriota bacterium]|nr:four-carbon acid sugar kinase family protein [Thermodesulfobacteriota bacterium]
MNPLIAVIADDVTGVCDTGAQFASAGLRTVGSVDKEFKSKDIPQVLIVNTQSRSLEDREASHCIEHAVVGLKSLKPRWFFKKIDTALRGHVATEVVSMMEVLGVHLGLYVAAIPGAGRTTVNGCQFFRGVPIKDSIHGEDRLNPNPISTSSNVDLFSKIPRVKIEVIGLDEVRSGNLEISNHCEIGSKKILIFDSETDADIDRIVNASMQIEPSSFFYIGSFGLSSALGRYLAESLRITKGQEKTFDQGTGFLKKKRVLVVSGSSHPMARAQLSFLKKAGMVESVEFDPEDLMERLDSCFVKSTQGLQALSDRPKRVVLTIGEGRLDMRRQSQELVVALAKIVRHFLDSNKMDGLVLIGGETSFAVCHAIGIERIEILGNISFVAAYGTPAGSRGNSQVLVTKGGSLGEEDTLGKVLDFIDAKY